MTISKKITFGIAFIAIVLVFIAVLILLSVVKINNLVSDIEKLPQEQNNIGTLTIKHYEWVEALGIRSLLMNQPFTKQIDHTKCDLGKWYYSYSPPEELKETYQRIEEPHRKFHSTAEKILAAKNQNNMELAIQIFQSETIPYLEATRDALNDYRKGLNSIINKEMHLIEKSLIELRNVIIISFIILIVFCFIFSYIFLIKPLTKNLSKLIIIADSVAKGDFSFMKKN
ncbi:MAG: CZB domain-containing protein [Ignavibacteria bacterium]|nr:CZB domain-containing protein [Ignavibacteria bacterium]